MLKLKTWLDFGGEIGKSVIPSLCKSVVIMEQKRCWQVENYSSLKFIAHVGVNFQTTTSPVSISILDLSPLVRFENSFLVFSYKQMLFLNIKTLKINLKMSKHNFVKSSCVASHSN